MVKAILVALIGLVLFGFFPSTGLAVILILFVGLRLTSLAAAALRQPILEPSSGARLGEVMPSALEKITPALPRRKMELGAEAMGVVAFALLLPLDVALYTRDFFSLRAEQGWVGAGVAGLCVALYAWPLVWLKSPGNSLIRILWWGLPFMPALVILDYGIEARHPYLNPFNPERNRLAAERVLSLKKYLLVTPVDLYINEANYVLSTSYPWGGLVSSARFGGPNSGSDLLRQRTAKQALCALLKSFNIRPSPDRNCVTSYARNLAEFDAKGSRPNAETLKLFRQGVARINGAWLKRKAMSPNAPDHAQAK
jgi:hypothetical protein